MSEGKPNYYAIIPADIRYDSELSDKAKLFYGEITCLANSSGVCFAGNSYFAELYGISERQVIKIIKLLEERNYICVVRESSKRIIRLAENPQRVKKSSSEGEEKFTQEGEEKFTHNNTSVNNINNNIYTADFLLWWEGFPRKEDKHRAFKNYCRCLKQGYTHEQLLAARDNYLRKAGQMNYLPQYIKNPANFLGRDNFFVDYISIEQKPAAKVAVVYEKIEDDITEAFNDGWYE
jgi:hypothetical protein